jgi:hypothetical protein
MSVTRKQNPQKGNAAPKKSKVKPRAKTGSDGGPDALVAEVKRLTHEVEAINERLSKRPAGGGDGGAARREQDKVLADRLARLDERVDTLWARVSDLEEAIQGEGRPTRENDFDEAPEKDFYER